MLQRGDEVLRVERNIGVGMLLAAILNQMDGDLKIGQPFEVQADTDPIRSA